MQIGWDRFKTIIKFIRIHYNLMLSNWIAGANNLSKKAMGSVSQPQVDSNQIVKDILGRM